MCSIDDSSAYKSGSDGEVIGFYVWEITVVSGFSASCAKLLPFSMVGKFARLSGWWKKLLDSWWCLTFTILSLYAQAILVVGACSLIFFYDLFGYFGWFNDVQISAETE